MIERIDCFLSERLEVQISADTPPPLADAMRQAVLAGGGRVRPRLCLAVADAYGNPTPALAEAAATALEFIHCASLVHDDLPCFDDAELRRGQPTVHRKYGEAIAVLVGDALINAAYETLAIATSGAVLGDLIWELTRATGSARGIIAGQAWESEARVDLRAYHRAKTGALFEAAAAMGAIVAGGPVERWREVGRQIGAAYQAADDIADATSTEEVTGKTVGRDAALDRPSLVRELGLGGAVARLDELLDDAASRVPVCSERDRIVSLLRQLGGKLCPPDVRERVALRPARRATVRLGSATATA